jgi:ABC-type antimicrobial peptide transport system permease subunit
MALGAQRGNVIALFFRQGARVTIVGVVVGMIGAALVARLISGMLFGISVLDLQTFLLAPLLLALMAVVAVILPAWRASKVDPNIALRYE